MGVWAPKRWELPLAALSQYTTPSTPKANPWIQKPKTAATVGVGEPSLEQVAEPPVKTRPKRRPPSRRIMRHVLRVRAEAVRALAAFFEQLEAAPAGTSVRASVHLARAFGGWVDDAPDGGAGGEAAGDGQKGPEGWRDAKEVVTFLMRRGGKIATLRSGIEGGWAALSSTELEGTPAEDSDAAAGERE
jgi:glycerol-3-phosphate O-acyltransferase/dihydroxyacetone phosphate acyltransferase